MDTIESRFVGTIDGFDISARLVPDVDATVADYDCYDEAAVAAWRRGDWSYVGTIVTASKAGITLGADSIWASEYGYMPDVEGRINPLDGEGDEFVNGYGPGLIAEAISVAKAKLAELAAV